MGADMGMSQFYFILLHHLIKETHVCLPSASAVSLPKGKNYRFQKKSIVYLGNKGPRLRDKES